MIYILFTVNYFLKTFNSERIVVEYMMEILIYGFKSEFPTKTWMAFLIINAILHLVFRHTDSLKKKCFFLEYFLARIVRAFIFEHIQVCISILHLKQCIHSNFKDSIFFFLYFLGFRGIALFLKVFI